MGYKISVLGDSMSTLYGYSNNVVNPNEHNEYYPRNDVSELQDTWWGKIANDTNSNLVCVDAISGTSVAAYDINNNADTHQGPIWCMNSVARVNNLGTPTVAQNNPDLILFFGGTNDLCQTNYDVNQFMLQYANILNMMTQRYTNAQIVCISPYKNVLTYLNDPNKYELMLYAMSQVVLGRSNCHFVSLKDVVLRNVYETSGPAEKDNEEHPTKAGMSIIANYVMENWGI